MWTWSMPTHSRRAGKRLLPSATTGKLRDEIHENAECVSEVVLGLVSVGTIKLDFMSIRETQQQQNFLATCELCSGRIHW